MISNIIFYLFIGITVGSACVVALSSRLIYSVFALLFTFFGVAGIYVFLEADFLAAVQLLIYVGGVLVLLLFGVMLTNRIVTIDITQSNMNKWVGGTVVLLLFGVLISLIVTTSWHAVDAVSGKATVESIGMLLLTKWLLPFEAASFLLLAALIGAALLARQPGGEG